MSPPLADDETAPAPWTRAWDPRGDSSRDAPLDAAGFLLEPEALAWSTSGGEHRPLGAFEAHRFSVLIGDAGMGKSFAVHEEADRLRVHGRPAEVVRLAAFGPRGLPFDRLLEGEPFARWRAGGDALTLFLDGFDECGFAPERAAELVAETLRREDLSRMYVRLATRPLAWSERVRDALTTLYGEVRVLRLLPLRRSQAREALRDAGGSSSEVEARLGPLLATPLTLRLVCDAARGGLDLSTRSLAEIYERALRHRMEQSAARELTRAGPAPTIARWMDAAELLGAATVLGGVDAFSLGASLDATRLDVYAALRGDRSTLNAVASALEHGPFSGDKRARRWEHGNFAEFFAARWIEARAMTVDERLSWLAGDGDGELCALPASVQGTLGWIASTDRVLFDEVCARAPMLLLDVDPAALDEARRARLVRALLESADLLSVGWGTLGRLRALAGDGLVDQLVGVFTDRSRPEMARKLAMWTSVDHPSEVSVGAALAIALDDSEPLELRRSAISATAGGRPEKRRGLLPLLRPSGEESLRDLVLAALWGDGATRTPAVSSEEIFRLLEEPGSDLRRSRSDFFQYRFLAGLPEEDLPAALRWLASLVQTRRDAHDVVRDVVEKTCTRVARRESDPALVAAFADLVEAHLQRHHALPPLPEVRRWRRALGESLVTRDSVGDALWYHVVSFLDEEDLEWALAHAAHSEGRGGEHWASISFELFRRTVERDGVGADRVSAAIEALESARDSSPDLERRSAWYLRDGLSLDDPHIRQLREGAAERSRGERELAAARMEIEASRTRALRGAAVDPAEHYWRMVYWACAKPASGGRHSFDPNLTLLDSEWWKGSTEEVREEVRDLGLRYLERASPAVDEWFDAGRWDQRARAGYTAALVLATGGTLGRVSDEAWARWMPALLTELVGGGERAELHARVVTVASARAPDAFREWVEREVDREIRLHAHVSLLYSLPSPRDAELSRRLLRRVDLSQRPEVIGALLGYCRDLLRSECVSLVERLLDECAQGGGLAEHSRVLNRFLISASPDAGWRRLIDDTRTDRALATKTVESIASEVWRDERLFEGVTAPTLAAVCEWALRQWPYREPVPGVRPIVWGEELREAAWRTLVDAAARTDASAEDRAALDDFVARHPELPWLPHRVRRVARAQAISRWRPWAFEVLARRP